MEYEIYYRKHVISLAYELTEEVGIFKSSCLLGMELWEKGAAILIKFLCSLCIALLKIKAILQKAHIMLMLKKCSSIMWSYWVV